jgi:hypothetical protein
MLQKSVRLWQVCHTPDFKKTTASSVPIVAIDVTTSLSLTGNRDWLL